MNESKKGIVVSDLHLLSWRSEGRERFEKLVSPKLAKVDTLVLNGDIFDFRWACRPLDETVPEAIRWVRELRNSLPDLAIHYVLGNHDCLPEYTALLSEIEGITIHPHWLRMDRNLFLHGDAANYRMGPEHFRRFRKAWENDQPKTARHARHYDLSDRLRLSQLTHQLWFAGNLPVRRISWHLDRVMPGWKSETDHCFFGHTHMPFQARNFAGIQFHNTGSGIRGMGFAPAEFTYTQNENE